MRIETHFFKDWIDHLRAELAAMGYQVPASESDEQVSINYFNALRRRIAPACRNVHLSNKFQCPTEHANGFAALRRKIENGDDLTPHLSRLLKRVDYDDDALNDWAVHHLHLGTAIEADGFANRTGPVVFGLFTPSDAHLIQVFTHRDFTNRDILEIVHENWPSLIANHRIAGIQTSWEPTNAEIGKLRKGRVNTSLTMSDGTVYYPIGGGLMSNGTGFNVLRQSDRATERILDIEQFVLHDPRIVEELRKAGCPESATALFVLEFDDRGVWAVSTEYGLRFLMIKPQ